MKSFTRTAAIALLATLTFVSGSALVEAAGPPKKALLIAPGEPNGQGFALPKFGFSSFTIKGFGERVTNVKFNGRAAQLGLEPGDVILALNGYPLTYHGSWNDALSEAVYNGGGWIQLKIRDVRTGNVMFRQTYIDCGHGPVTPKYAANYGPGPGPGPGYPHVAHHHDNYYGKGNTVTNIVDLIKAFKD